MKFEYRGEQYEVDENNVMFNMEYDDTLGDSITGLTFREPIKTKDFVWVVTHFERIHNVRGNKATHDTVLESDQFSECWTSFVSAVEKKLHALVKDAVPFFVDHEILGDGSGHKLTIYVVGAMTCYSIQKIEK